MLTMWIGFGLLAAEIHLRPGVIGRCTDAGLAAARVEWSADAAPVSVWVNGVPMTGPEAAVGSLVTGEWVTDGTEFTLRDGSGAEIARTGAVVDCGRRGQGERALEAGGFWPLEVGNRWVYRVNSRQVTGAFEVEEVTRAERVNGRLYFIVEPGARRLREDAEGRVVELTAAGEQVVVDPVGALQYAYRLPGGEETVAFDASRSVPLLLESTTYARGIGLVASTANVIAGSSGGFARSRTLVEARVGGVIVIGGKAGSPVVEVESDAIDVTGRRAANCAVPCYFVACGLVPGADPPGTYKPCVGVRTVAGAAGEVSLEDAAGRVSWRQAVAAGEGWVSAPLYERPNEPVAPGTYWMRLRVGERESRVKMRLE